MSFLHKNRYKESNIKIDKIIIMKFIYPGKFLNLLLTNSIIGLIIIIFCFLLSFG